MKKHTIASLKAKSSTTKVFNPIGPGIRMPAVAGQYGKQKKVFAAPEISAPNKEPMKP